MTRMRTDFCTSWRCHGFMSLKVQLKRAKRPSLAFLLTSGAMHSRSLPPMDGGAMYEKLRMA